MNQGKVCRNQDADFSGLGGWGVWGLGGFGVEGCAFVFSGFGGLVPGVVGSQRCKVLGELLSVGCRFGLLFRSL